MATYIHFTKEQKEQARQTDLCDLLRRQGETLKRSGSEVRMAGRISEGDHSGQSVVSSVRACRW